MLFTNLIAAALLGFASAQQSPNGRGCGFKIAPCPAGTKCVPNDYSCTDLHRCPGTCYFKNQYQTCGGFRREPPPPCKEGTHCIDDSRIPGSCGMACDAPGICAPIKAPSCGGFMGKKCPKGLWCYDDPRDDCDPKKGGADCIGICL
ncbi:Hypothetical protein NCS54_01282500 [Fusarium falciforme]|uniref:Uncharacterized protein n=1 Tax=Fusarium falciforme TaxID=195108 RepID=A0A9W8RFE5_9HYPO|nr:Hypothetical protein NCS54_01282500 [Fusarium falciforme]KAJ4193562.1 hypothetical protein NW755_003556 [Fusarium falciforme]KAJ4205255.1 hypothetical protein NW767_004049 [Fusarium falciforme]KAJ4249987.1 hypothetical protein NW757_007416 [Fusarium falciforme]WAO95212.1 Hypothetical protein NCS54_01282500 [Fusarium falciforme]